MDGPVAQHGWISQVFVSSGVGFGVRDWAGEFLGRFPDRRAALVRLFGLLGDVNAVVEGVRCGRVDVVDVFRAWLIGLSRGVLRLRRLSGMFLGLSASSVLPA
ncbi:MAG: hypothetical protein QXQ37_03570 [Nitrososphaerota archaeon]